MKSLKDSLLIKKGNKRSGVITVRNVSGCASASVCFMSAINNTMPGLLERWLHCLYLWLNPLEVHLCR